MPLAVDSTITVIIFELLIDAHHEILLDRCVTWMNYLGFARRIS